MLIYSINLAICSVRASRVMHFNMLKNILRSPMVFFETTPTGRILNRFSRDVETIDNTLPSLFRSWVNTTFTVISTIVVISYSTPIFLVMIVPLALLYYFIQVRGCLLGIVGYLAERLFQLTDDMMNPLEFF